MNCCVCGRAGSDVEEHKNTLTKQMTPYCLDCLLNGREPYKDLVDYGWDYGWFNQTYQQKVIIPTLNFNNKTVQQFNEEVRKLREEKYK